MKTFWKKLVDTVRESQFFDDDGKKRTDPNSKYACFFTAAYSYFRKHHGMAMSWTAYKTACLDVGAIREDFYLLNRNKMAIAAGVNAKCVTETGEGIAARALQLITLGKTCICSLGGEHYETIVGAEGYFDAGKDSLRFLIEDPGYQNDTYADYNDLIVYHENEGGERVESKSKKGGKRQITTIYWWA